MAVSQKQIAEKLGVSIALVSRVLSGKAEEIGIAPETILRVSKAAEEMGYVPSAAALAMKGKATQTVGVVVYDFKDPFFGAIVEQLQVQAHEHNYSLILTGFIDRIPQEQDLQPLYKHAIDGLIVIGTDLDARWLNEFRHVPVVRIGHGSDREKSVRISVDERAAAALLMDYFQKSGRSRPVYVCADLPAHRLRYDSFRAEAAAKGMELVLQCSSEHNPFVAGMQATQQICRSTQEPDGIICATDQVAMGALNCLREQSREISVTGFDDIPSAAHFMPGITTIRQPLKELARNAFQFLIQPADPHQILLPGELIVRASG
jgi:LacI family transcriptional regulator